MKNNFSFSSIKDYLCAPQFLFPKRIYPGCTNNFCNVHEKKIKKKKFIICKYFAHAGAHPEFLSGWGLTLRLYKIYV
jgi:hypothetical protein